jgi:flagellin-specific chaperone FliS
MGNDLIAWEVFIEAEEDFRKEIYNANKYIKDNDWDKIYAGVAEARQIAEQMLANALKYDTEAITTKLNTIYKR